MIASISAVCDGDVVWVLMKEVRQKKGGRPQTGTLQAGIDGSRIAVLMPQARTYPATSASSRAFRGERAGGRT
jgi:hypothetical protein